MLSNSLSIIAEPGGRYRARCKMRTGQAAEYLYSVHSHNGVTTCRLLQADGSFGDPFDADLITSVIRAHRTHVVN